MYLSRVRLKQDIAHNSQLGLLLKNSSYNTHQLLWDLFDQQKRDFLYREEIASQQRPYNESLKGEPVYYLLSPRMPKSDTPLFHVESKEFKPHFYKGQRLAFRLRANPVMSCKGKRHDLVMDEQITFYKRICVDCDLPVAEKKSALRAILLDESHSGAVTDWLFSYLNNTLLFSGADKYSSVKTLLDIAVQEAILKRLKDWLEKNRSRNGIFSIDETEIEDDFSEQAIVRPALQWNGYNSHPIHTHKQGITGIDQKSRFLSVEFSGQLIVHDPQRFLDMIVAGIGPAKAFGCGLMLVKPV